MSGLGFWVGGNLWEGDLGPTIGLGTISISNFSTHPMKYSESEMHVKCMEEETGQIMLFFTFFILFFSLNSLIYLFVPSFWDVFCFFFKFIFFVA